MFVEEIDMKKFARLQKVLATPLALLFVALLLVCAIGTTNTFAAFDGSGHEGSGDPGSGSTGYST